MVEDGLAESGRFVHFWASIDRLTVGKLWNKWNLFCVKESHQVAY